MARKQVAPSISDYQGLLVEIYSQAEAWDGSRGDAQESFDSIQNSIEEIFPDAPDLAAEEADDSETENGDEE